MDDVDADSVDKKKQTPEVSVETFGALVADMSRFLTRLAHIDAFKDAKLGLAEWLALSMIQKTEGIGNKQLAKLLGITGQRANQICDALKKDGLIAVSQAPDDSRKNSITVTPEGASRFTALNEKLTPQVIDKLQTKERSVGRASKMMKTLLWAVAPAKADGKAAKSDDAD